MLTRQFSGANAKVDGAAAMMCEEATTDEKKEMMDLQLGLVCAPLTLGQS